MTELFLIIHKVRGEPAFDIATRMEVDGEEIWIIPTSGHRAYPARAWNMNDDVISLSMIAEFGYSCMDLDNWKSLPDHYQTSASSAEKKSKRKADNAALEEMLQSMIPKSKTKILGRRSAGG